MCTEVSQHSWLFSLVQLSTGSLPILGPRLLSITSCTSSAMHGGGPSPGTLNGNIHSLLCVSTSAPPSCHGHCPYQGHHKWLMCHTLTTAVDVSMTLSSSHCTALAIDAVHDLKHVATPVTAVPAPFVCASMFCLLMHQLLLSMLLHLYQ